MKCVILGFGFLAQYILPCLERRMGKNLADRVIAVKATDRDIEALRRRYPFPIRVQGGLAALEEVRPELILIAVKPHQVQGLLERDVAPYLQRLRAAGLPMPDIYSFAANPAVQVYGDVLCPNRDFDLNIACMIPNMLRNIEGRDLAPVGISFVSFDPRRCWPEQARRLALDFMRPTGTIVEIPPEVSADFVALNCACHVVFDFCFIAQAALRKRGIDMPLSAVAQGYRANFRGLFDAECVRLLPWDGASCAPYGFVMATLLQAWHDGLMDHAAEAGVPEPAAQRNVCGSMEAFLMEVQLESRDQLLETTRQHATAGGFLEKVLTSFSVSGAALCEEIWRAALDGKPLPDAAQRMRSVAREVVATTAAHGRSLAR